MPGSQFPSIPHATLRISPFMSPFQAIFFDFDGVLLDTEPVHWACWAEMLATVGLTLTWEYYRDHCIGIDDRDMLRTLAAAADPPRRLGRSVGSVSRQEAAVSGTYGGAPIRSGLQGAAARPAGARTSSPWSVPVPPARSSRCWWPAASARISTPSWAAATSPRHKPAPEPYLLAAARLGVERALVLEDSAAGIASGRAAGFEVLTVRHPSEVAGLLRHRLAGLPGRMDG